MDCATMIYAQTISVESTFVKRTGLRKPSGPSAGLLMTTCRSLAIVAPWAPPPTLAPVRA